MRVGRRNFGVPDLCEDYMVPQMREAGVDKAFKYISLQIGSNDLCSACGEANPGNHQRTYSPPQFGMLTLIL